MSWTLAATRFWAVTSACSVVGLLAGLARGATAPVPSLTAGSLAPVPVVAVLALVPAVGAMWGWSGTGWATLACSARSRYVAAAPVAVASVVVFAVSSTVLGGSGALLENGRNAMGMLGVALIGAALLGERGILLPVPYLLLAFLFGRPTEGSVPHWWAWVLADGGATTAAIAGLVTGIVGLLLLPRVPVAALRAG